VRRVTAQRDARRPHGSRARGNDNEQVIEMTETRYTPEIAAEILRRVSSGEPLRQVCRDKGMPPESSFRQWIRDDRDGLAAQYQQARAMQIECWSDEIVLIANDADLDPQDKRVRVDTLKWLLSTLAPKRWGDRLLVAGDAENPVQHLHAQISLANLSATQLAALEQFTTALIEARHS
jgi:hypothetical protein